MSQLHLSDLFLPHHEHQVQKQSQCPEILCHIKPQSQFSIWQAQFLFSPTIHCFAAIPKLPLGPCIWSLKWPADAKATWVQRENRQVHGVRVDQKQERERLEVGKSFVSWHYNQELFQNIQLTSQDFLALHQLQPPANYLSPKLHQQICTTPF